MHSFFLFLSCYFFLLYSAIAYLSTLLLCKKSIVINMLIKIKTWSSIARSSSVSSLFLMAAFALYIISYLSKQNSFILHVFNTKANKTRIIVEHFLLSLCLRSSWTSLHTKFSPAWCQLVVYFCTLLPLLIHDIWGVFYLDFDLICLNLQAISL